MMTLLVGSPASSVTFLTRFVRASHKLITHSGPLLKLESNRNLR